MLMTIQLHKLFIMLSKNFHTIGDALVILLLDRTMATIVSWCQFSVTGVANNHFPAANMQKQIHKSKNKQNDRTAKLFLASAFDLFSENTLLQLSVPSQKSHWGFVYITQMKANTSPYFKPKKYKVTPLDGSNCLYSTILTSRPPLPSS